MIEGIGNEKDFEKSDTEIERYPSIEELKYLQEFANGAFIFKDDLNERKMNDPRVQAMFKSSRHYNLSILIISQE